MSVKENQSLVGYVSKSKQDYENIVSYEKQLDQNCKTKEIFIKENDVFYQDLNSQNYLEKFLSDSKNDMTYNNQQNNYYKSKEEGQSSIIKANCQQTQSHYIITESQTPHSKQKCHFFQTNENHCTKSVSTADCHTSDNIEGLISYDTSHVKPVKIFSDQGDSGYTKKEIENIVNEKTFIGNQLNPTILANCYEQNGYKIQEFSNNPKIE